MQTTIKAADLMAVGYEPNETLGLAIKLSNESYHELPQHDVIALFKKVKDYPENFLDDETLGELASKMIEEAKVPLNKPLPYTKLLSITKSTVPNISKTVQNPKWRLR